MKNNLRKYRKIKALSQEDLAEIMETTQHQISKWETGKQDIGLKRAAEIANILGITLDELAGRTPPKTVSK